MIKLKTATLVGQDHVKLNHNIYLQPRRNKRKIRENKRYRSYMNFFLCHLSLCFLIRKSHWNTYTHMNIFKLFFF